MPNIICLLLHYKMTWLFVVIASIALCTEQSGGSVVQRNYPIRV